MSDGWRSYLARIEDLARGAGLDYHPVEFEAVPDSMMMEIAIYGLPVRMPHWSFGVRYIYRLVQHRMGLSRLFEVVFPGNPGRAYLARNNSDAENVLVTAHVLGHADFSSCNLLFRRSAAQVGQQIVEQAATHARQIGELGKELYDRLAKALGDLRVVGSGLNTAVKNFNAFASSLESRALVSARKLKELNVETGAREIESIPPVELLASHAGETEALIESEAAE